VAGFKPVKQVRISEEIMDQLKAAILAGRFKPGQKLPSERELTAEFQASRVVVREAIRALELTGFVAIRQGPAGGAYVTELSFEHLGEAFLDLFLAGRLSAGELVQVRLLIEPEVARLAATLITPEAALRLRQTFEAEHRPAPSQAEWVFQNLKVHYLLAELSGNRFYQAIVSPILRLTQEMVVAVKPGQTVIHEHAEHEAIVRAVSAGRAEDAAGAMREHVARIGQGLVRLEQAYRQGKRAPA